MGARARRGGGRAPGLRRVPAHRGERQARGGVGRGDLRAAGGRRALRVCRWACSTAGCPAPRRRRRWPPSATGATSVLVATTVIEVGVDVANATVMVILSADRFGIAQLHQLRGRVGRGAAESSCYLVTGTAGAEGDAEARAEGNARLEALVASDDGFELAEVDLEIRGEGTLFAERQKGRSDLKLASLRRDKQAVLHARAAAERLVADDGDLTAHPDLQDELRLFLDPEDEAFLFKSCRAGASSLVPRANTSSTTSSLPPSSLLCPAPRTSTWLIPRRSHVVTLSSTLSRSGGVLSCGRCSYRSTRWSKMSVRCRAPRTCLVRPAGPLDGWHGRLVLRASSRGVGRPDLLIDAAPRAGCRGWPFRRSGRSLSAAVQGRRSCRAVPGVVVVAQGDAGAHVGALLDHGGGAGRRS